MTRLFLILLAAALFSGASALHAREATRPYSQKHGASPLATVPQVTVAATDVAAELAFDGQAVKGGPLRIAAASIVELSPAADGVWENVPGGRLWRLRINAPGATDVSLGFARFQLHDGATVHFYAETEDYVQGEFSARDNKPHSELWTPVLPGERCVIEMFVPDGARAPELALTQVNRGYRDMFRRKNTLGLAKAGACENDVVCAVGDPWRNEIRSVARYTISGQFLCTGQLINDVAGDRKNFFLTAAHCSISVANAASIVVYWNYQAPVCGQQSGGSLAQNQNGVIFRMTKADVDTTLVELEDVPDAAFNVYYSGWDRTAVASPGAVGIHHPNGDEKSISFASATLSSVNNCIGTGGSVPNTHWQVVWNDGVTEPGSSGSGIWNPITHRVVGVLSGGGSFCDAQTAPDCYGKFGVAWTNGTTAATRLRDWLDPLNLNSNFVAGLDSVVVGTPVAKVTGASLAAENCVPTNGVLDPGESVTISVTVTNSGTVALTNVTGTLLAGTGVSAPGAAQSFGAIPVGGSVVVRPFTFIATGACGGTISVRVQLQEGIASLGIFTNTFTLGVPSVSLSQNFDAVVTPALPAGWTTFATNGGAAWVSTTAQRDSLPNALFTSAPGVIGDAVVTTPSFSVATTNALVSFRHQYDFENTFDGGVLEISIGAGPFTDILASGGVFLAGSYTATISTSYGNTLGGRQAWSGLTSGFITSTVRLPASAAGQSLRLRWRAGTDDSNGTTGWYVDSLTVSDGYACCSGLVAPSIVNLRRPPGSVAFSFNTLAGQTYQIESKGSLATTNWQFLQTVTGDGTLKHFTNTLTPTNRFFRLRSP
jgi:hypothetical protein